MTVSDRAAEHIFNRRHVERGLRTAEMSEDLAAPSRPIISTSP